MIILASWGAQGLLCKGHASILGKTGRQGGVCCGGRGERVVENLGHLHCIAFSMQLWKLRHCQALSFLPLPHPCSIVSACFSVSQRQDITVRSVWHWDLVDADAVMGDSQKCLASFCWETNYRTGLEVCLGWGGIAGEARLRMGQKRQKGSPGQAEIDRAMG